MQKGDLISEVSISGQLRFSNNEDLLFTSPGKISKIHIDENSSVSKGDILASLEDIKITELEKNVAQALANVEGSISYFFDKLTYFSIAISPLAV